MARKIHKRKAADSPERMSLSQYLSSFSGPIVFFLVIVTTIFVMSIFFRITNIQVEGNTHYTDEEIIQAIDIEEGDNLFFFDRFSALSRVFAKLPYVEEVSVERSLPNKVIITVTESQALAYIALGDEMWSIDHSCKVLGKATEEELADMISIEGISPGTLFIGETMLTEDNDTELVEYLAQVLYQLEARDLYKQVESIDFSDKYDVVFALGDKYTVKLGGPGDTEYKFGMLVSVMSQLLEGDIGIIDVSDGSTAHFRPM
ncbi:MAG TPA: FtsQ-type POTRA domain-containing protein [Candidatus Limivicinus faecipullorum]|nr:FtsQ-type POTRA domain-containing protein [Candidatus Limivicinus faecipullorum]